MASNVLAIEMTAHGQGSDWRKGEHLIDALPYVDALTSETKQKVDQLIQAETRSSTKRPSDYLAELPPMPALRFEGHPLLAEELTRCVALLPCTIAGLRAQQTAADKLRRRSWTATLCHSCVQTSTGTSLLVIAPT